MNKLGNPLYEMELKNLEDTKKAAEKLVLELTQGSVICLIGDLGAGKTTLTQFICEALGVNEYVTSPSFSIMNAYEGVLNGKGLSIYHFDTYRISDPDEMDEIGFDEFLFGEGICIIEWANLVRERIPENAIWIQLKLNDAFNRELSYWGPNNN